MEHTATCACKNVSITLSGEPNFCFACHCDYCQRLTGSVAVTATLFRQDCAVSIDGDYGVFDPARDDWPELKRYFCPNCASTVYWVNPKAFPDQYLVSVGCFSDPAFRAPDLVVQTQYRHTWCAAFDAAQSFEEYAPE